MEVVYTHGAGLDVHKRTVVACLLSPAPEGGWQQQTRTFSTMTRELLVLADWLVAQGCTHVAIESTGEYWKPVFNILEGVVEVLLVNAAHVKHVPGRKTDVKDAQWLAELLQHGLLRPSFIPPVAIRDLRDTGAPARQLCADTGDTLQSGAEGVGGRQHQTGLGSGGCVGRLGPRDACGAVWWRGGRAADGRVGARSAAAQTRRVDAGPRRARPCRISGLS